MVMLNPLNENLCDCSVMYQFQSDASAYFWIGVAIALAGCYMVSAILKMFDHYKTLKPYKEFIRNKK